MKLSRRQFLQGTSAFTAGLLLSQLIDDALARPDLAGSHIPPDPVPYIPVLVYEGVIKKRHNDRDNESWGNYLSLYGPLGTPRAPVMTHREAAAFLGFDDLDEYAREKLDFDDDYNPLPFNHGDIAETGIYYKEWYYPYDSFEAVDYAYSFLTNLDTSLRRMGKAGLDCIDYVDQSRLKSYKSTNDSPRYAWVTDKDSLHALQERLSELDLIVLEERREWESSLPQSPNGRRNALLLEEFIRSAEEVSNG